MGVQNPAATKTTFSGRNIAGLDRNTKAVTRRPVQEVAFVKATKEMTYVSLHHHSTYSYMDGFGLPSAHVRRAAELGMPSLALTEHGNVSSHAKLAKAADEYGVKPIFGCELYTANERVQRKNHLTVLAQSSEGYRNLLAVVSQGWADFYYEPTVSGAALRKHKEGLVILSGCTGSLLSTSLVGGKNVPVEEASYERAKEVAKRFKATFGDRYFLECQMFPELENVRTINQAWERLSRELGIPLVATGDCHYTKPDDSEMQQILHSIGRHKTLEELAQSWGYDVPLAPMEDKEVMNRLLGTGLSPRAAREAIRNTAEIAHDCQVTIPTMEQIRFPAEGGSSSMETWREWLKEGWRYRKIGRKPSAAEYREQLLKEMDIIESKDFIDYFLVVSDIVKFAKDRGIPVGPARGSAAASLVCYLLRITEVDPMLFPNMMFERFIDYNREDLPDIDLDFDDERRVEVFEYAAQRYGRDKVGKIGTFTYYKSKNSLDDIAYVYRVPKWEVEKVKELLVERSSGDLRASATIEDTVEMFDAAATVFEEYPDMWKSTRLEGNVKGMGIHAAGLVVATRPIREVCAVYTRTDDKGNVRVDDYGNSMEVISMDKYDAEAHNLLKMDILGLKTMGMIRVCLEIIGKDLNWLYSLPMDDEETMRGFMEADCIGIFQFDGWAMRSVCMALRPESFDEVAAVNALARPGPLHSNASDEYIEVKRGKHAPRLSHPLLDPIVASTRGQIIYQEQILRIVTEIGDFSWTHAAYIRRIISRKIGEQEFNRQFETFQAGAKSKGMDDDTIKTIWGACITAGAYAFNVAHCVSYGMLGYWTMYLKRHYPQAFFVAALQKLSTEKQLSLLRDAYKHGIRILPPDKDVSGITWGPSGSRNVVAGFEQIPGVGYKTAEVIIAERECSPYGSWRDLQRCKGIGGKTTERIEAFASMDDPFEIHTLTRRIDKIKQWLREPAQRRAGMPYPTHTTLDIPAERGQDIAVVWLGTIHTRNLRDLFEINFAKTGEPLDLSTVRRPDLPEWVIMHGEDHTERCAITVDRYRYPQFKEMVWGMNLDHDLVLVQGIKKGYSTHRQVYVTNMWVIDPD